jgi:hypothetical protein
LAGDYLLDLFRNASHNDLPLRWGVVRKALIDSFRNSRVVGAEIRDIAGNSFLADRDYRADIGLTKGHMMLPQFIT